MSNKQFIMMINKLRPTAEQWSAMVKRVMSSGCLPSFDNMRGDYTDVYPLAGAIFETLANWSINGSCNAKTCRMMRREANKILKYL